MSAFSRTLRIVLIASMFMFGTYILLNIPILTVTVERPLSKTYEGPGFSELSKRVAPHSDMAAPSDMSAHSSKQVFQICGLAHPVTLDESDVFSIIRKGGRDADVAREMLRKGKSRCAILRKLERLHGR